MASIAIPFLPAGFNVGSSPLPTVSVTPAPATIPINFVSDLGAAPGQIVGTLRTGIPFNQSVSGGGISLPLAPLPTARQARVSLAGAYPMKYQTAGSNLIEGGTAYATALSTYNAALGALFASTSYVTYLSSTATYRAAYTAFQNATFAWNTAFNTYAGAIYALYSSSDYATFYAAFLAYTAAGSPGSGPAYNTYQAALTTYNASTSFTTWFTAEGVYNTAINTWQTAGTTFASAVTVAAGATVGNYFQNNLFDVYENAYFITYGNATNVYNIAAGMFHSNLITGDAYIAAGNTYAAAGAAFIAATNTFNAGLSTVTIAADATAYGVLQGTSDFATWFAAYGVALGAYATWVPQFNVAQSALNWWQTFAQAVSFFNSNQLRPNPYSSVNPV